MSGIVVEEAKQSPVEEQRMEFVERKGIGHPDSICDAIMENVSIALCSEYLAAFGRILHYNEIVFEVGFQSITHFNRIFKRHVGKSPTEYRESFAEG